MNPFDDIIQQKANGHEAPVPITAWDNIIKKKKKKRIVFFWWFAVLLVAGLGTAGYFHFNKTNNEITVLKTAQASLPVENKQPSSQQTKNVDTKDQHENATAINETIIPVDGRNEKILTGKKEKGNITNNKKEINSTKENKASSLNEPVENTMTGSNNKTITAEKKNRSSYNKSSSKITAVNKNTSEKQGIKFFTKNKTSKKQKARSKINIQTAETGEEMAANETKNNKQEINREDAETNSNINKTNPDNKENVEHVPVKKNPVADSIKQKKNESVSVQNKKEKIADKKKSKKHSWFIDAAIAPVFPFEQYDHSLVFNRTLFLNNDLSEFSGKLISTKIDPSVAYSLSLRKKINSKLTAGIGFQYLQLKESIHIAGIEKNTRFTIVDKLVPGATGPTLVRDTITTITEGNRDISAVNSYRFLSIPVFIHYNLFEKKTWSLDAVAGTYIIFNSRYKNEVNKNASALLIAASQPIAAKNNISMAINAGLRFGKILNKRFELFAMPSMTWNIGNQNIRNAMINKKIQQAGINVGLSYKLN